MFFDGKKVIIYGTGISAEQFINIYHIVSDIVCCIDKIRLNGFCKGIPIMTWEDIEPGMADCVVIAANEKHVREIYSRIIYDCDRNKLEIYDWLGVDLREGFRYEYIVPNVYEIFNCERKERLLREIDTHEAISFDLFDTLIMRRVMEPEDVFDYIDCKLDDGCRIKGEFKALRRQCEIVSDAVSQGFKKIYDQMQLETALSRDELEYISELEMECEKELIICRDDMKALFNYAIKSGKRVYIISDMYMDKKYLCEILDGVGIKGYEEVFISCEYGKTKRNGLFDIYKKTVMATSYLHIGDNDEVDGQSAEKSGIDSFLVPSGMLLLRASSLRKILYYAKGNLNRRLIGEFVASVFNDPFCLSGSHGAISITSEKTIGRYIVAPAVFSYYERLQAVLQDKNYDRVLLGARDGYVLHEVIKEVYGEGVEKRYIYLYISRILAFKLGLGDPVVDEDYRKYIKLDERRKIPEDEEYNLGREPKPYRKTKEAYKKYMERLGIKSLGNYLFCDLISGGTVQHSLQPLFDKGLDGFYYGRTHSYMDRTLSYTSVLDNTDYPHDQLLVNRLEMLVSSPEPSVNDINLDGSFVFENETRSQEDIEILRRIQDEIIRGSFSIIELADIYRTELDKKLPIVFLQMLDHMRMAGDISRLTKWVHYDINGEQTKVFK